MKRIYLFLVASENIVEEERMEITTLVRMMNERYGARDIHVRLFKTGEARGYKLENLSNSEMVFLVCNNDISKEDLNCFNIALEKFQSSEDPKTPKIITYFKAGEENRSDKLVGFLNHLDKDLGHYYTEYSGIETLKYYILLNLLTLEDGFVVEYKEGNITVDGYSFGTMAKMTCMANHKRLQELKNKYEKTTQEFYDAMDAVEDDDSDENNDEYERLGALKSNLKKSIEEIESNIFTAMLGLSKAVSNGELSARSKQAYRYLELGEYEKADDILDFSEISSEISHQLGILSSVERTKEQLHIGLRKSVDELLQKIETLTLRVDFEERFASIEECYVKAFQTEIEAKIEPKAGKRYIIFLQDQKRYEESIKILDEVAVYYENNKNILEQMNINNLYAWSYTYLYQYIIAKAYYETSVYLSKSFTDKQETKYKEYLSSALKGLANLYPVTEYEEAEVYLKKALKIRKELSKKNPKVYKSLLANIYNDLSILHRNNNKIELAKKYNLVAINILKEIYNDDEPKYEITLGSYYLHRLCLYAEANNVEEAKEIGEKTLQIYEKLAKQNPDSYEQERALAYKCLGAVYYYEDEYTQCSEMYIKALEINQKSARRSFDAFGVDLATTYIFLGVLYENDGKYHRAFHMYKQAYNILTKLEMGKNGVFFNEIDCVEKSLQNIRDKEDFIEDDSLNMYEHDMDEIILDDIFSCLGKNSVWCAVEYDILQNEDEEILMILPYSGDCCCANPKNAKLFYDGEKHVVLKAEGLPLMICTHINEGIRKGMIKQKEIIVVFSTDDPDKGEDMEIFTEFKAKLIYLPGMPISEKSEFYL